VIEELHERALGLGTTLRLHERDRLVVARVGCERTIACIRRRAELENCLGELVRAEQRGAGAEVALDLGTWLRGRRRRCIDR